MSFWLPLSIPLTSLIAAVVIFLLDEHSSRTRTVLNLASAVAKIALVVALVQGVAAGNTYFFRLPLFMGFDIVLQADAMSLLFSGLSALLWLVTTIYAVGYLEVSRSLDRRRFFGFFSLCVSATTGIAMAGNLFTFLVFYELLTITTYPLVAHRGTPESIRAGRIYLGYTLGGGAVLLAAVVWLQSMVGAVEFVERGVLAGSVEAHRTELIVVFVLLMIGFGVKAGIVPLHGWLPVAMVAPAPVSALLHAVAVVKAGAFGIVRTVYDVFGADVCTELGVRPWLAGAAGATILYGSLRALAQDDLKRRLAYSTVSQLSYIVLGVALVGPIATVGGLVHLVHQGIMKITLFFCAGNLAEELGLKKVSQLDGVGRRMPWTMAAFSVGALGMIGIPPTAGFVSKWMLASGAIAAGSYWAVVILLTSSALNAAYFLPILRRVWFEAPKEPWPAADRRSGREIGWTLLGPALFTAASTLLLGIFAASPASPLGWARLIAARELGL